MFRFIGLPLLGLAGVLLLSLPQSAAAQTRFGVYVGSGNGYAPYSGYTSPYYTQPYNYAPYGAYGPGYGAYYGDDDRWRDRRWRREEEHREHEWREHERREHEHREHERREHDRRW